MYGLALYLLIIQLFRCLITPPDSVVISSSVASGNILGFLWNFLPLSPAFFCLWWCRDWLQSLCILKFFLVLFAVRFWRTCVWLFSIGVFGRRPLKYWFEPYFSFNNFLSSGSRGLVYQFCLLSFWFRGVEIFFQTWGKDKYPLGCLNCLKAISSGGWGFLLSWFLSRTFNF